MRVSSHQEEKDAKERRERRMTYATSLPAIRVPPHLQASSSPSSGGGHGVKHAATSVAYLPSPAEAPDRRLKERIYQSELDALRATENQVGRKVAQANIRSAWLADQLEQRKQEERELEHKVEQEKRKWLKRRELEAEIEKLRDQLKEAWGAIASGHSVEAERYAHTYVPGPPYCTYGPRVPAVCVLYVLKAQGSLPPGPHALHCTHAARVPASGVPYLPHGTTGGAREAGAGGDGGGEEEADAPPGPGLRRSHV